ncbi:hypothetical protein SAMN05192559_104182 [Halobacillus karajensis]|uniref:S1 motif domain-containing protein n=1 Tax=Halobacillus karajensis TaxID=195088 RepID=A0A024P356_9BACI|nr:S1-like domain-containing RNA-binding protein [Halobacillus karajensis]CDQ19590.1 hypothetical protein BN982_01889 [Halobacillus karajensis]CDQ22052.1 hypothetical protein BN983_00252 [Halobacillus karajensis]CDQ27893.1 hypothetical protein BN981_02179 [Halobacillus karajensis]SEH79819.1 hypothetical protein SAMN05192559_104182 [Halobacillus karajensis]
MKDINHILGTVQKATVEKKITNAFILKVGADEIVLPEEEVGKEVEQNEELQIFIYENKKGQAVATLEIPEVTKETYGWSEVVEIVPNMGVFVDIGLSDKDILVSTDHLPLLKSVWPQQGDHLFVSLELDKKGRLLAEPISEQEVIDDLEKAPKSLMNKELTARVYKATKAGTAVLTGEGFRGFIHPSERKHEPRLGETIQARVIDVKEDGSINLSLRPLKQEGMKEDAEMIYEYLQDNDGVMFLHDKSDPEDIRKTFKISKAAFKRAIGQLLKERKIIQKDGKTMINHNRS